MAGIESTMSTGKLSADARLGRALVRDWGKPKVSQRLLSFLALTAIMMIPMSAAHASTNPGSNYVRSTILPPGADYSTSVGVRMDTVGNAINSEGNVAANANFGQDNCGEDRAFVYFRKAHRYVVLAGPASIGGADTEIIGIADDNSVGVIASPCSNRETFTGQRFIYLVTSVDTTPRWSQPCACPGYLPASFRDARAVGYNSDGVALNNPRLGPAVLTFPDGAAKISPLAVNVGPGPKAGVTGVGTPDGFVGTQYSPKLRRKVQTAWIDEKPYVLPAVGFAGWHRIPYGMDERETAHGLRIDVVGSLWGFGGQWGGPDYWLGKRTAKSFAFVENAGYIRDRDMANAYGISTDGSMVFGLKLGVEIEGLEIYYARSHRSVHGGRACNGPESAWGDSHGDILIDGNHIGGLCLAHPKH